MEIMSIMKMVMMEMMMMMIYETPTLFDLTRASIEAGFQ